MSVPFIDLRRFERDFLARWAERAADIAANTRFVGGPEVERLERRLADSAGVTAAVGCANGTDALQLALRALGVGKGDVVVIPDATFWATFEAVVNVGARVVTVDIDPDDLQMDFERFVESVETFRPKAAILVHLYGWSSARLDDFRAFCRQRGLPLVEDGAQSWGTTWRGAPIHAGALVSTVSFYPAKVLGACGDAGAVLTSDDGLAAQVRMLGNHGRTDHYEHGLVGWNSRMGGFEAAWLDLCLDYLDDRLASRRRAAAAYRERLGALGIRTVGPPTGYEENGYLAVTRFEPGRRDAVAAALRDRGIGTGTVYPGAMSRQSGAEGDLAGRVGGEAAAALAAGVLNPPLFAGITDAEIDEVVAAFAAVIGVAGDVGMAGGGVAGEVGADEAKGAAVAGEVGADEATSAAVAGEAKGAAAR